jgi:hypothetical protein
MGSKAILMAPLLARELLDYIYQKKPLDSMININRFSKKINDENVDYANSVEL